MIAARPGAAARAARTGVLAVVRDEASRERLAAVAAERWPTEAFVVESTLAAALRGLDGSWTPRALILDIAEAAAPVAEIAAARAAVGETAKLVALGAINDVGYFRALIAAGAADYLVKPPTREALLAALDTTRPPAAAGADHRLGEVVVCIGSRGGVGATTTAVACAWLLAEEHAAPTALLDLDLHFGTIALKLDAAPGTGLCEALEQPARIDDLFLAQGMIRVTERLRVLATEASAAQALMIDAGAIDLVIAELRRQFRWVVIDLPRGVTPMQRVVLAAASRIVLLCERSLAGLRDTVRLQALVHEQSPQARLLLVEAGAPGARARLPRAEFQKALRQPLDAAIAHDAKAAGDAAMAGKALPTAAPRSQAVRDLRRLAAILAGAGGATRERRLFDLRGFRAGRR